MAKKDDEKAPTIIIKKVKKVSGGHHGGAWKVAYADFVTAMMAFFLLLWLLNVTTAEQKDLISSYFAPTDPRVSKSESGSGGVMGGKTMSPEGAMSSDRSSIGAPNVPTGTEGREGEEGEDAGQAMDDKMAQELDRQDARAFETAQDKIKQAVESIPELKELSQNLLMDMTPEGLRIQIVDQEGKPMFESGSATPLPQTERMLRLIGQVVKDLPNKLSIRGHTDSKPYGKSAAYTNWELSADRANASRRILLGSGIGMGIDASRLENVQGKADREPLVASDPESPKNRRISIILLKQSLAPVAPKRAAPVGAPASSSTPAAPIQRKREEGVIYFP